MLLTFTHVSLCGTNLKARDVCNDDYTLCDPRGASTSDEPPIGSAMSPLFIAVVNTVDNDKNAKRDIARDTDQIRPRLLGGGLCCKQLTSKEGRVRC